MKNLTAESITEFTKDFTKGKITELPETVTIGGIAYRITEAPKYSMKEIAEGKKPMVIYSLDPKAENKKKYDEVHKDADDEGGFQDRLVMVWALQRLAVRPVIAKFVSKGRMGMVMVREAGDPNDDRDIGSKIEVILSTFNHNKPIDAKVDTGAEMSSIRVNNLQVNERQGVCSFQFYNKKITMSYDGYQAVNTNERTENRPLVKFNVVVPTKDPNSKDIVVSNVQFNLNNVENRIVKGDGYQDLLLGLNFVNAGKFRVVGRAQPMEGINWDALQEMFEDVEVPEVDLKEEMINWLQDL